MAAPMSASRLQSNIIDKALSDDNGNGPVEGVYGTHGFYFQQRRGRLDLRALGQLDLDEVIRNVDVEPLQALLENITFCNLREEDLRFVTDQHVVKLFRTAQMTIEYLLYAQEQLSNNVTNLAKKYDEKKRNLLRKRNEVIELKETSKQLKQQLKAKKRGIDALEEMLKEANRVSAHNRRKHRDHEEKPVEEKPPTQLLQFFVSGPDGLCVEFQSKSNSSVRDLKREVREAFRQGRDGDATTTDWGADGLIRLMRHGRVMVDDSTLQENGLRSGDTVIAVMDKRAAAVAESTDGHTQMILNFMGKQQDSIAGMTSEMRQGWEKVVEALTKKGGDPSGDAMKELLIRMEDRWGRMEATFREGINGRSEEAAPRRKYRAGDLESDHDENYEAINTKMKLSSSKIINLEMENEGVQASFKRLQDQHEKDMSEIRNLLKSLHGQPAAAPQQVTVESTKTVISGTGTEPRRMSRWNDLAGATEPAPVEISGSGEAPEVLEDNLAKQVNTATTVQKAAKKLTRPTPKVEKPVEKEVTISFHKRHNQSLSDKLIEKIDVVVPRDISMDDLIFEMRREVADRTDGVLARVTLELKGQEIALGIDVPGGKLDPVGAAELASRGDLIVKISDDRPITDAQLDVLVSQMEKSQELSRSGRAPASSSSFVPPASARRSLDIYKQSLRYSSGGESQHEDEEDMQDELREEERWWQGQGDGMGSLRAGIASPGRKSISGNLNQSLGNKGSAVARQSLDNMLRNLNEKDGMTDDELKHETNQLRRSEGSIGPGASHRLKDIQKSIVGAVSAAVDSGSEDFQDGQGYSGRGGQMRTKGGADSSMRLSHSWMSGSGGSLMVSKGRSSRDYDSDEYRGTRYEDYDGPLTRSIDTPDYYYNDDDAGKDSVSRHHARLGGHGTDRMAASGSSIGSLDVSHVPSHHADLERTVDTDVSLPINVSAKERAQQYEDEASNQILAFGDDDDMKDINVPKTPSPSKIIRGVGSAPHSAGNQSTGSGSPFFHMGDETHDGGSLALSESHDTFADLDASSRSLDARK